jgi:DNA-binding winged helix-turn-helix (wHTH) protein
MCPQRLAFGPFVLDMDRGALVRDGRPVAVGHKGLLLLHAFLRAPGQVLCKADLMQVAWPDAAVEDANLSVQIAALRKLLGPPPDGAAWIATVPRIGYRFVGRVDRGVSGAAPTRPLEAHSADQQPSPSIAVLPFTNISSDNTEEYLVDGITEDIITALTRFRWFRVIARNSTFAYKGKSTDCRQVACELAVRYLLEGSVRKSGQ